MSETPTFGEDGYYWENQHGIKVYDGATAKSGLTPNLPTVIPKLYRGPERHGLISATSNDGTSAVMTPVAEGTLDGAELFEIEYGGRTFIEGRVPLPEIITLSDGQQVWATHWTWRDA